VHAGAVVGPNTAAAPARGAAARPPAGTPAGAPAEPAARASTRPAEAPAPPPARRQEETPLAPSVRKLVAEHAVDPRDIDGTGKDGRLTEGDVLRHLDERRPPPAAAGADDETERVPMTELRRVIAARLVEAQRTAAILTTFNEIDLAALLALRQKYRERFKARHGVDLGLVSLVAHAAIHALGEIRVLNACIDGGDIVYHRRVHLGIAVSTKRGLVVPVVRNADALALADLERAIGELAGLAREGRLGPDHLAGGTFTLTNGGVFGSMLSTPILNPPQSGILGMHKIQERPVAVDGQIVIRPMMYVALSYDHRLVDGEQAVTFLVRVKEQLEDPARIVLDV
jgi:2-oxoglutarate dehydrogenase E2 component (dihydrolipoamide succinyltransferase)